MLSCIRVAFLCMEPFATHGEGATPAEQLAQRVRDARLPSPAERSRIRRDARVTLREFADVLGVTTTTVYRWELGETEPKADHAVAYADLLRHIHAALASTATEGTTCTQEGC